MKFKNIIMTLIFALFLGGFSIMCILKSPGEFSESERRPLAQKPVFSIESVSDGEYMTHFEEYAADQIPFREALKNIKANFVLNVLNKKDNNGIFSHSGHISKLDSDINPDMLDHAAQRFEYIYNTYLKDKDMNIYLSVVPDKNYYLSEEGGYPSLDYQKLIEIIREKCPYMTYIDITGLLDKDDYYKTDTHWKMENITRIAEYLAENMGTDAKSEYEILTLDNPFYGVYAMQSSLNVKPDEIKYLTNETLENCTVTYFDTGMGKTGDMYNMDKAYGKDPYEMFLSGSTPLCTIENPNAKTEKELILFRDSFGSSIAPLFAEGYKKITVVDIRYVQSEYLESFIDFENQDVLFLYSTMLLNNSLALR